jgi:AcrR family transcriptional regulator
MPRRPVAARRLPIGLVCLSAGGYGVGMNVPRKNKEVRRNRGFDQTHSDMIEMAVRLISQKGADALSLAALAREMGITRATVYYHFDSREALLVAVKTWAADQLVRGMDFTSPAIERIVGICRFVLENPELIKLWIDDFIVGDDIRTSYASWDALTRGVRQQFDNHPQEEAIDEEVYCTIMLTAAFIAPKIYANSVRPDLPTDEIIKRFVREQQRVLRRDGIEWND